MNPETKRGLKEGHLHFETLRARWPRAFAAKRHEIGRSRPALRRWSPPSCNGLSLSLAAF